jgi:hypothetical protein
MMPQSRLTPEVLKQTADAYIAADCCELKAATSLGVARPTYAHRLRAVRAAFPNLLPEPGGGPKAEPAPAVPVSDEMADMVAELNAVRAEIASIRRDTVNQDYIRRKIIKLSETPATPPDWLVKVKPGSDSPGVPTLFASDWHWAERVDASQIGGVNSYDVQTAHRRARRMIESAISLLTQHMAHPNYPGIVFALGGDMVSGNIHDELVATNEIEIMPTVVDIIGVLIWCIRELADRFGRVFVPCVSGNHGRDTHKIRMKGRNHTSFDWLIYCLLERHFEADDRVTFYIPNNSDARYRIYGHRYLLTHGDQFRGGDGMIGALGPIIRGDHRKRGREAQVGAPYDTMLIGHWHQYIHLGRLIVNGSLKGYDEYAHQCNFGFEQPQQALWITHPVYGITFAIPVKVGERRAAERAEWVSWAA